ncbi:unnamed protein product [Rotaria sp. Silwood2]|nr:unnamed protein product [Rotaria sp. Silwood2]CAF3976423.1 unnamed protein product [Rotaria sp. Silwood2]CAF4159751.1 unnamed protein product [Rotaria sp. Silwood2]
MLKVSKTIQTTGFVSVLAHLLESIFQNQLGVWLGPFLVQDKHVFTLCLWISIRVYQAINAHSGYDLPYITSQYYFP